MIFGGSVEVQTDQQPPVNKEDLLTYKNLQKYATKYVHIYNMKYNKMAA